MAYTQKPWLNSLWLVWFSLQLAVILLVDAVQFYPQSLYLEPGSPLHPLWRLHTWYVATYNDPIVQWDTAGASHAFAWTGLFAYLEMGLQLPVALYGVYRLGGRGAAATSGRDELLFLVYALETALSTLVCIHNVGYWDEKVYPAAEKAVFVFQLYGPWFAVPMAMFVDMYLRLHSRLGGGALDTGKKNR